MKNRLQTARNRTGPPIFKTYSKNSSIGEPSACPHSESGFPEEADDNADQRNHGKATLEAAGEVLAARAAIAAHLRRQPVQALGVELPTQLVCVSVVVHTTPNSRFGRFDAGKQGPCPASDVS